MLPDGSALDLRHILLNLGVSLVLGLCLSIAYAMTRKDCVERKTMIHTLVLLTMTIAVAMMIIGNNLARAFGLVGAVSIIRFRTAMKNPRDMAFVFIVIVVGMSSGLGAFLLASIAAASFIVVLFVMEFSDYGHQSIGKTWYRLKIEYQVGDDPRDVVVKSIEEQEIEWRLRSLKVNGRHARIAYSLLIDQKKDSVTIFDKIKKDVLDKFPTAVCTLRFVSEDEES